MYNRLIRHSLLRLAPQFNSNVMKIKVDSLHQQIFSQNYHSSQTLLHDVDLSLNQATPEENSHAIPENEKLLNLIKMEIEVLRLEGKEVPSRLRPQHYEYLLNNCRTKTSKRQYLKFLFKSEMKRISDREKKIATQIQRKQLWDELDTQRTPGSMKYTLTENSMFLRFHDKRMNVMWNNRMIQAIQFESKIVFDCDYERFMKPREVTNAVKQLTMAFAQNRQHHSPLNLYLCNADRNSAFMKEMKRFIPTLYDDDFPMNVTESCYLDIFDKKDLVYLTPDCNNNLNHFDPDKIYIVGALVDKSNPIPLSRAKAKRQGVAMARLPLDNYLQWGDGSGKNLTLNQMMGILLDVRLNDWPYALQHVPQRKLTGAAEYRENKRMQRRLRNSQVPNFTIENRRENLSFLKDPTNF